MLIFAQILSCIISTRLSYGEIMYRQLCWHMGNTGSILQLRADEEARPGGDNIVSR